MHNNEPAFIALKIIVHHYIFSAAIAFVLDSQQLQSKVKAEALPELTII